ncbi:TIR domain-containing protein [Rickettsiales bacterium]|nr:TIR domain-containing protein [Rickettsiales bacterium]
MQNDNNRINIFISHSWANHHPIYQTIVDGLKSNNAYNMQVADYSVPKDDPFQTKTAKGLRKELTEQIEPTSVVLILVDDAHTGLSKWMDEELQIARQYQKPIVFINLPSRNNPALHTNTTNIPKYVNANDVSKYLEFGIRYIANAPTYNSNNTVSYYNINNISSTINSVITNRRILKDQGRIK